MTKLFKDWCDVSHSTATVVTHFNYVAPTLKESSFLSPVLKSGALQTPICATNSFTVQCLSSSTHCSVMVPVCLCEHTQNDHSDA
jgi:hypothetical protein